MDDLVFLRHQVVNLLRLFTRSPERTARTRGVVDRARIVMTKLNQHDVAGLHVGEQLIPQSFRDKRAAAAAPARAIDHVDFRAVKVIGERHRPTLLRFAGTTRGGGIAGDENGRQAGVDHGHARRRIGGEIGRRNHGIRAGLLAMCAKNQTANKEGKSERKFEKILPAH